MQPRTNTLAVISLVSGIASYFMLPILGALVAIVTGHLARSAIRANPRIETGDGLAVTGLVLGYLHFALACLVACAYAALVGGVLAMFGITAATVPFSGP